VHMFGCEAAASAHNTHTILCKPHYTSPCARATEDRRVNLYLAGQDVTGIASTRGAAQKTDQTLMVCIWGSGAINDPTTAVYHACA
jgi:hypothetical protein